ncbi:unnamed protein product [Closterium sp. NIES-53]
MGSKYFITFLDDFSRLSWVTLVKTKDEVAKVFKRWIRYAEREARAKVKILRPDRGGEYMGKDMESFFEDKGITYQLSVAYTPQQNGAAERLNQTLIDLARAMLAHAQLDHTWWGAAVQYANWVKNRMGSKGLERKSPYFMWTRKAQWGIFLEVSERSKAWMLWSVAVQRVVDGRDVVFHEGLSYKGWKKHGASTVGSSLQDPYTSSIFEGAWEDPREEIQEQQEEQKAAAPHHEESPSAGSTPDPNAPAHDPEQPQGQQQQQEKPQQPPQKHKSPVPMGRWQQLLQQLSKSPRSPMKRVTWREKLQSLEQGEASPLRRTTRISRPPERFTPSTQYASMHDHESVKEALSRPEWVESMREELDSHKVNESFELVDTACVPPGMEVLRCQWVWKYKHKDDGSIERPKSRLVAMGNTQTRGVHYDQVFTPVGKPTTLRGSLGMAASSGSHIYYMDVTTAYLHGVLKEELHMRQPPGFDDGFGRVCRLKKSIYRLKQAPRQWYLKFDEALMDFGFERSECDPALYHLVRDEGRLSLYLNVDDIVLMSSSMVLLDEVKGLLSSRFRMKDLGEAKYYLGAQEEVYRVHAIPVTAVLHPRPPVPLPTLHSPLLTVSHTSPLAWLVPGLLELLKPAQPRTPGFRSWPYSLVGLRTPRLVVSTYCPPFPPAPTAEPASGDSPNLLGVSRTVDASPGMVTIPPFPFLAADGPASLLLARAGALPVLASDLAHHVTALPPPGSGTPHCRSDDGVLLRSDGMYLSATARCSSTRRTFRRSLRRASEFPPVGPARRESYPRKRLASWAIALGTARALVSAQAAAVPPLDG